MSSPLGWQVAQGREREAKRITRVTGPGRLRLSRRLRERR